MIEDWGLAAAATLLFGRTSGIRPTMAPEEEEQEEEEDPFMDGKGIWFCLFSASV